MNVNIISESIILPKQLGGVHVAFVNQVEMLKQKENVKILINSLKKADITHIHTIGPFALFKLLTSSRVVLPAHHLPESFIGSYRGGRILQFFIKQYLRFFYNKSDLVLAMTDDVKDRLLKLKVKTRIEVLPNPINIHVFKKDLHLRDSGRQSFKIKNDAFIITSAGYLIPRKGIVDFILLAHKFPEFIFLWVGGQPAKLLAAQTEQQTKLLHNLPENLIITGFVPYRKMPMFYNMSDIFLFPSHQETQGFVIIEAAACGLPLVLRDLELYKKLYSESYIAAKNNDEFEKSIKKLHNDLNLYKQYSIKSEKLGQKFSYSSIVDKLINLYKSLLH